MEVNYSSNTKAFAPNFLKKGNKDGGFVFEAYQTGIDGAAVFDCHFKEYFNEDFINDNIYIKTTGTNTFDYTERLESIYNTFNSKGKNNCSTAIESAFDLYKLAAKELKPNNIYKLVLYKTEFLTSGLYRYDDAYYYILNAEGKVECVSERYSEGGRTINSLYEADYILMFIPVE